MLSGAVSPTASPTWEFTVPSRSASIQTHYGLNLDFNGDGFADAAVLAADGARVHLGGATGFAMRPVGTIPLPADVTDILWSPYRDFNNDGYADFVVTAGASYSVFHGGATLPTAPAVSFTVP